MKKMTSDEVKAAAKVMLAAANGQSCRCRVRSLGTSGNPGPWVSAPNGVSWDWKSFEYELEPMPVRKFGEVNGEVYVAADYVIEVIYGAEKFGYDNQTILNKIFGESSLSPVLPSTDEAEAESSPA